ncbi:DUF397 domain-containing protein [Kitasatospora sp. NPDC089509]|uniref:DUF397 domain-containing protein n=1 Tax=Kitasatospora sp. NPDC089509 TaxID=3364079 RepID=UPI0037F8265B
MSDAVFRKSSHSNDSGNCVELGVLVETATFKTSSHSGGNDNCVEIAHPGSSVSLIRDSKDPSGPSLAFDRAAHTAFISAVTAGEFDFGLL